MTIRAMTLDDLKTVLGWAANEGWDPGLEDAAAFLLADPAGFLIKEVDGDPVAAISVVNHDPDFAFLGLYICKPEQRGEGHGMDIWRAGIAHAGGRSIGLDGVPDQQANYARSGFKKYGSTIRYAGQINTERDPRIRTALPSDIPVLVERDKRATGMRRATFVASWLSQTQTRQTLVLSDGPNVTGFATFRRCWSSGIKIGPLYASSEADALALLSAGPFGVPQGDYLIDVIDDDSAMAILVQTLGFELVFETARMFRGDPPSVEFEPYCAIATMELG